MDNARNKRKVLQGIVVSDRMVKTISVDVERVYKHPKYGKYVRRHKKYHAHDENRDARSGDIVEIVECRPLSRLKRWRLVRIVGRGSFPVTPAAQPAGGVA